MGLVSFRGLYPTTFAPGREFHLLHQSRYPFTREASSLVTQFPMDTWTSIPALMIVKHLSNLLRDLSIFSLALTGGTLTPSIKTAFRDFEHLAHHRYREFMLLLLYELISHLLSREKMLIAFFSISRSCWTLSSSRLRRRFSSSNEVWCPLPGNASSPCRANSL